LVAGLCFGAGEGSGQETVTAVVKGNEVKVVPMTIDYGDGVQKHFKSLVWKEGMTIFDALQQAAEHPRGIKFKSRGKQETALVTEIDALLNGTHDKYWIFSLNGKEGDRSCALVKVQPGDAILWKFSSYP
jgi:hypothetical protein